MHHEPATWSTGAACGKNGALKDPTFERLTATVHIRTVCSTGISIERPWNMSNCVSSLWNMLYIGLSEFSL